MLALVVGPFIPIVYSSLLSKPFYMPGPFESATQIRRRIEQLQKHLGDDGFEFETAA